MRIRIAASVGLVSLAVAIAFAAKIKADFDKTAEFSAYKTYAWGQNLVPQRPAAAMVITGAINYELQAKGLQQAEVESAELIVRYQAAGDQDMNFGAIDPTYAQVGGVPLPGSTVWTAGYNVPSSGRYLRKGTLVIDIFDQKQRKLIWTAMASDTISDSPKKAINQINHIVEKMFTHYPVRAQASPPSNSHR